MTQINIEPSWMHAMQAEFDKPYFKQLIAALKTEKAAQEIIYPPGNQIFAAFNQTPIPKVKVVLLGQDPYHGPGQANGLCFSVNKGIDLPPSLQNIFKELSDDCQIPLPTNGDLTAWAQQGVLLINSLLTVKAHQPLSHQYIGWEQFTDAVIRTLSEQCNGLVFLLWGKYAQSKTVLIDTFKHFILTAPHPSPLSAYRGFLGCKHFTKANHILLQQNVAEIRWDAITQA
ncbi:MAG: uracil-DNA glycosylase [Bacteroidia bacterium]|nr:uracil-DNA glycosylase [Bacteroidia bacterium]HQV00972.1 uracil-DNA glycosylase [Bacteroidia bacterium]